MTEYERGYWTGRTGGVVPEGSSGAFAAGWQAGQSDGAEEELPPCEQPNAHAAGECLCTGSE